jgi:hypothetical protein
VGRVKVAEVCGRAAADYACQSKRIYESSRGWLEVETFETFDSREIWLTFFDEKGWERHRVSWGPDALQQPDSTWNGRSSDGCGLKDFLRQRPSGSLRRSERTCGIVHEWSGKLAGGGGGLGAIAPKMWASMYAALTTTFWLSVSIPGGVSTALIGFGGIQRRYGILALGIVGLLASVAWLFFGLYVEAVIE